MASSTCHVLGVTKRCRLERIVRPHLPIDLTARMKNMTAIARKTNEATAWNAKNDQQSVGSDASAAEPPHLVPGQRITPVCSARTRSEEHTSEHQSLMRISY